ncbi:MAG: PspA/IM30 family protein [Thermoanaerobaculia bacterium]
MSLMKRWTTLIRADAHGVVDALEDKALVLRQHLRDASAELDRKRCRITALAAEGQDLEKEADRSARRIEALDRDVAMALAEGQEDLARYAIKRLLPLRHGAEELERRRTAVKDELAELGERLAEQEAEYQLLESRVQGHLACLEREREGGCGTLARELVVTDEDVEIELLRRRQTAEGGS